MGNLLQPLESHHAILVGGDGERSTRGSGTEGTEPGPSLFRRLVLPRSLPLVQRPEQIQAQLEEMLQLAPGMAKGDTLSIEGHAFKLEQKGDARVLVLSGSAGVQQPLQKVLLGSLNSAGGPEERWADVCGNIKGEYVRHLSVGDYFTGKSGALYFVIDCDPDTGGGLVTSNTSFHLSPEPLAILKRVRFARMPNDPPITDDARLALQRYLRREAGRLFLVKDVAVADQNVRGGRSEERFWIAASLDESQSRRGVFAQNTLLAIGDAPLSEPSRCLGCDIELEPPSPNFFGVVFECPTCRRVVINGAAPLWGELLSSPAGPGRDLLMRVRAALETMAERQDDQRVEMMTQILSRLPRDLYGRLDFRVLDEIARRVEQMNVGPRPSAEIRGVPPSLVERLPTCKFTRSMSDTKCQICLVDFEVGEDLRVMPCFHKFHKGCIDSWLAVASTCPLCKLRVDQGFDDT